MAKTVSHRELKSYFGNEDHLELSQKNKFSDLIFELLSEKSPTPEESKVFELILNLSIDHGPDTPSAKEVIRVQGTGGSISEAVAAGVLQINDTHGGAIEPCMEMLYRVQETGDSEQVIVKEYLEQGKRVAGYGHRIYKEEDPRAELILERVQGAGGRVQEFVDTAREIEKELEKQKGNKLPINIDGAIAVALCSFGWDARLGKAVFLCARIPGLCAQFLNHSS